MHPEKILANYQQFCREINVDAIKIKRSAFFFRILDATLKLPLLLLSSAAVLISSINISENNPNLNTTILVINASLTCLTAVYMYISPASRADKADICLAHLIELNNDVNITINELSVDEIIHDLENSEASIGSDREMYQHYLVMMTRYSMKKMIIGSH